MGRLWSYAGLVVWLRAMRTMENRKEPFILTRILFICVTHACPICVFKGRVNVQCLLLRLHFPFFNILLQTEVKTGQWAVLTTTQIGHSSSLPLPFIALRPIYFLIIKSYLSLERLGLIHLCLSFNRCHTACVFCVHQIDWIWLSIWLTKATLISFQWDVTYLGTTWDSQKSLGMYHGT